MASSARAKRVTLAQVAELAGVSVMTASYTYNRPDRVSDQARSKVLAAAGIADVCVLLGVIEETARHAGHADISASRSTAGPGASRCDGRGRR